MKALHLYRTTGGTAVEHLLPALPSKQLFMWFCHLVL